MEVNNIVILEEGNIAEDKTVSSEELAEEIAGDKDTHEDVPLEDPGPDIASEDAEEGAAGATQ